MELKVFSIRDSKGEVFNTPFFQKTLAEAERSFSTLVNDPKSFPSQYPEDFDLWHLGEFDDLSGVIKPFETPRHVAKGIMLKKQAPQMPMEQTPVKMKKSKEIFES